MPIPTAVEPIWYAYLGAVGAVDESRFYEAFAFGDSEALADGLARLVLSGVKRATAASVWSFDVAGKRLPAAGDLSIVTTWSGTPLCIIETMSVEVVPFNEVTAEFAASEGEGDGSLALWQRAHRQYFIRECEKAGRQFTEQMPVACERFKVVYQPER